ncbi:hypothetical protein B0H19DRAFT_1271649 [Mycena capillaripes]|nr:hypothetical protein B0H19DRAFT_1271649 [Mycena capillaripes]
MVPGRLLRPVCMVALGDRNNIFPFTQTSLLLPRVNRGVQHSSSSVHPSSASCFFSPFRDYKVSFLRAFFPQIAPPFSYTCARVPAAILLWNVSSDLNIQFSESSAHIPNAVHAQQLGEAR